MRVPLSRIVVTEYQPRYIRRVIHYWRLLVNPRHLGHDAGIVMLTPCGDAGLLTLLDGHHRYLAAIIAGRSDVLAIIHYPPSAAPPQAAREAFSNGRHERT